MQDVQAGDKVNTGKLEGIDRCSEFGIEERRKGLPRKVGARSHGNGYGTVGMFLPLVLAGRV